MTDLHLITALMAANSDAVGFIPLPDLQHRFVDRGRYLVTRDRRAVRRGYLIHGPVHIDRTVHIHQAVIDVDHRRRILGTAMIEEFLDRAAAAGATRAILRCADDLDAIQFWRSLGAVKIASLEGGKRRNRSITVFSLPTLGKPNPSRAAYGPFACLHGS